jgi:hypothetical protein
MKSSAVCQGDQIADFHVDGRQRPVVKCIEAVEGAACPLGDAHARLIQDLACHLRDLLADDHGAKDRTGIDPQPWIKLQAGILKDELIIGRRSRHWMGLGVVLMASVRALALRNRCVGADLIHWLLQSDDPVEHIAAGQGLP